MNVSCKDYAKLNNPYKVFFRIKPLLKVLIEHLLKFLGSVSVDETVAAYEMLTPDLLVYLVTALLYEPVVALPALREKAPFPYVDCHFCPMLNVPPVWAMELKLQPCVLTS